MKFSPLARSISLGTLAVALSIPLAAQAAFIEDSKASLELRNFYMNRDFRNSNTNPTLQPKQSKAEEWAQGLLLRYESGFTEGTVGVGVDAYVLNLIPAAALQEQVYCPEAKALAKRPAATVS